MKKQLDIKPNKSLNHIQIIFFLIITGCLIFFIGTRFLLVGAWPILIFGLVEFLLLVICTLFFIRYSRKRERVILNDNQMQIQKIDDEEIVDNKSYNLYWTKIKNDEDNLSVQYAGKRNIFAKFLSPQRRLKLKKIIDRYKSRYS
tara:strand:+ start:2670 stop:3104 length:435 start_codon:yes stop_codon:yes gene_type:complete